MTDLDLTMDPYDKFALDFNGARPFFQSTSAMLIYKAILFYVAEIFWKKGPAPLKSRKILS